MNGQCKDPHHHKTEDATFWAHGTPGKPSGTVQSSIGKVSIKAHTAVRHRIEKSLAKIETCMPSHHKPEIASAPQGKGEYQSDGHDARRAHPIFSRVSQVHGAKGAGKQNRRRPESDPIGKCVLSVAAEQELFEQTRKNKNNRPQDAPAQQLPA